MEYAIVFLPLIGSIISGFFGKRLGDQFCVRDTDLALDSLSKNSFVARSSKSLVI